MERPKRVNISLLVELTPHPALINKAMGFWVRGFPPLYFKDEAGSRRELYRYGGAIRRRFTTK